MKDISIVTVSFNTRDLIINCLESIRKTVKKNTYEVFVVDNASSDDSIEVIKKYIKDKKDIILIDPKANLGFSKANNLGIKKSEGRYLLFLNPDTVVNQNTIDYCISEMDKNKDWGALTCKVVMPNGQIDDASHRGFPTPWNSLTHFSGLEKVFPKSKLFSGYSLGWMNLKKRHQIDALAGAFMLVRREAGDQVGWWDEDFFFYGEDLHFCYSLKQRKWKIYYLPEVSILHFKGVSGGLKKVSKKITTATKETTARANRARFEAMRIFYNKNYKEKYPKALTWLVFRGIDLKQFITSR